MMERSRRDCMHTVRVYSETSLDIMRFICYHDYKWAIKQKIFN